MVSAAVMTYLGAENKTTRELENQGVGPDDADAELRVQDLHVFRIPASHLEERRPTCRLALHGEWHYDFNTQRTPLIIDPATQASEWLKKNLKTVYDGVEVLNHTDVKFNT